MIDKLFTENILQALGWTLVHSLWQAAIIAIILGLTLILLRKNSSKVRYFVSATALFTLFLLSIITFFSIYQNVKPQEKGNIVLLQVKPSTLMNTSSEAPQIQASVGNFSDYLQYFASYFEEHLPLIVTVWTLGVLILLLRFIGAFAYLQRMKFYKTTVAPKVWQDKVNEISQKINLKKKVQLLESSMAKVPMVIGFFKPVVLVPVGTLTGLSTQQVENILAHELAHIVRNDYLVNMIQSVVEIIFFFNPLVWWISGRIREERENCCDDIAIQTTGDRLNFVRALASLEEMRVQTPELAVALNGQGSLLGRIKRLANQKVRTATFSEGLVAGLVLILFLFSASFEADAKVKESSKTHREETSDHKNTIPYHQIAQDDTIRFGKGFMLVTTQGKHQLFKDGVEIQEEDYEKYKNDFSVEDKTIRLGSAAQESPITIRLDDSSVAPLSPFPHKKDVKVIIEDGKVIHTNDTEADININFDDNNGTFIFRSDEGKNTVLEIFKDENLDMGNNFIIKNGDAVIFDAENFAINFENNLAKALEGLEDIEFDFNFEDYNFKGKELSEAEKQKVREEMKKAKIEIQKAKEKIKEHKIIIEKEHKERLVEEMERVEEQRARVEEQRRVQKEGFENLKEQLVADGLASENDKEISVKVKNNEIQINGKTLKGKEAEKYKKLLKEYLKVDTEKVKGTWHWKTSLF